MPLILGLTIPVVLAAIVIGITTFRAWHADPLPPGAIASPMGQAYFNVKVSTPNGDPVTRRSVVFTREFTGSTGEPETTTVHRETDAAGIATISVPRQGAVLIEVDGWEGSERIRDIERAAGTRFDVTIVLHTDGGGQH